MKIAILDDSRHLCEALGGVLQKAGHEVLLLSCWFELNPNIAAIQEFDPDIVLLDEDLGPNYSGRIVAKCLGYPPEKLVDISINQTQRFCVRHFWKKDCLHILGAKTQLLRFIEK
ncbi:MAG: hypothetical protein A3J06_01005 [Candidatus Moranbacteria bacterium RIFCSPLOWO2_02_FULL_48_19]|nr:MAG: hypothetical protein A3J06_01005 [Candidatus Moranbacteria bacterium RIFCSPLOWO2_02_FULL_48_19]OGI31576.1 MAG: hypothetical protein A3G09_04660 [Candidatus Moranbacteria bacterium RIFCSPLOWO2_12_FULL_48_12]